MKLGLSTIMLASVAALAVPVAGCAVDSGDESSTSASESSVTRELPRDLQTDRIDAVSPLSEPNPIPWRASGLRNPAVKVTEPNPIPWSPDPGPNEDSK